MNASAHKPLRIGLLVNSLEVPAWCHEVLEEIVSSEWGEVALVLRNAAKPNRRPLSQRLAAAVSNAAYLVYERLDERVYGSKCHPNAFESKTIKQLIPGVPVLDVTPRQTKFSDYFSDDDVQKIVDARIDVLLRWGFRILRGEVLSAAKHGIWSFHHGDSRVNRGSMPGFWEVMLAEPTTGSV